MRREIKFLIEMSEFNLYEGFEDLRKHIFMADNLEDRFNKNDYIDLLACTLLYHQIIERMIDSLLMQYNYYKRFIAFSNKTTKVDKRLSFYKKLNLLEESEWDFYNKSDFIDKCKTFNKIRNDVAHRAIVLESKLFLLMQDIRESYHEIQEIFQDVTFKLYNEISEEIVQIEKYLQPTCRYKNDLKELKSYVLKNWKTIDIFMMGKVVIKLYVELNNRVNPNNKMEYDYIEPFLLDFDSNECYIRQYLGVDID